MKRKWFVMLCVIAILAIGLLLMGPMMSQVEQPKYNVLAEHGAIEIRQYAPQLVAEVRIEGAREDAVGQGFRLLADFIFGNNLSAKDIAMTAPVRQQSGQKIAMTAPVKQQADGGLWRVQFVMPSQYNARTLPKPNNEAISIIEQTPKQFAVIRFSGRNSDNNIAQHEDQLKQYITDEKLTSKAPPVYAFYNPPWTLPTLRRNEVMVEIEPVF